MAEQLNEFPAGRLNKYDWDKWLDGRVWKVYLADIKGRHPHDLQKFISAGRARATYYDRKLRSTVNTTASPPYAIIQAVDVSEDWTADAVESHHE